MPMHNPAPIIRHAPPLRRLACVALLAALSGCGGSGDGGGSTGPGAQNAAPTLSGSPAGSALVGTAYSFQPSAQDPENATLTFSIQNKPAWASFSTSTGALTGTPTAAVVGTTSNIVISVSDGTNTVSLAAFSITVSQAATASARVTWTAPTTNTDGSTLADLAGFRIYYGASAGALNSSADAAGAATRAFTIGSLLPGTYYFSITAYNSTGTESTRTTPVAATLQ